MATMTDHGDPDPGASSEKVWPAVQFASLRWNKNTKLCGDGRRCMVVKQAVSHLLTVVDRAKFGQTGRSFKHGSMSGTVVPEHYAS